MSALVAPRTSLAARYAAEFPLSAKLHEQARGVFPHGVTHDGRYLETVPDLRGPCRRRTQVEPSKARS